MIKRILPLIFALFTFATISFAANVLTTENEFIRINVNQGPEELGRFSIDTTGGDPNLEMSKNQQIIYGGASPWTSFTTVNIDGVNYIFGGETNRRAGKNSNYGTYISGPTLKSGAIVTAYRYGEIEVTQFLSISRGTSSRMLDAALIKYEVKNKGNESHNVGIRITLDTKLGKNDGAPIRIGSQSLTSPHSFTGDNIPMSWQAFDKLADPNIIAQGNLYGQGSSATKPDKIVFADWGTMADHVWNLDINEKQGFWRVEDGDIADEDRELDTAAAIYWDPTTLEPNQTNTHSTSYGIGYIKVSAGKLALGITCPSEVDFMLERTEPISVTGYLVNTGNFTGNNVKLKITLPKGLKIIDGTSDTVSAIKVEPGAEMQGYWKIMPTGEAKGEMEIKLTATSDNIETNSTSWKIIVNVPDPRLVVSPSDITDIPTFTNDIETIVPINIILTPALDFISSSFELHYNPAVIRPLPIVRGPAMVDNGKLLPEWKATIDKARGVITFTLNRGTNVSSLTQAEAILAAVNFYVVNAGESNLKLVNATYTTKAGQTITLPVTNGLVRAIN